MSVRTDIFRVDPPADGPPTTYDDDPFCLRCGATMTLMGQGYVCGMCGWEERED